MNRVINIKLCGNYLSKDNKIAGVRGEANVTKLRITFDEDWDGYAKKITFWDAHGTNPVKRIFTADCIEDILKDSRTYLIPIPHEPMAEAGMLTFVIDGYVDDKRQRSISDKLEVKDAPMEDDADNPIDPTPTQAEQLQVQYEYLLTDVDVLQERINKIKYYGDADIEISPDEWFVFNDEEHTILGGFSEGHENETDIVIPYSVTTIAPDGGFCDCSNLTSVIIPNSIVTIRSEVFFGCSSLTSITIPDSVKMIQSDAFYGCSGLTDVTIGSGLRRLNSDAFDDCVSLTNIVVSSNNKYFSSLDNVVFSKDKTELMLYPQGKKDEQYVIPDSVTKICQKAFAGCPNLKSVKMCDNAIELGDGVFGQCINLESIELSNKITYISNFAFYGCSSLASVTIPNSVTDLGMSAFGGCDSLTDIYYDGTLEEWNAINDGFSGIDDLTKIHTLIAKGTCGDNLTWTLNEDYELVIDGIGGMYDFTFDENDIPWQNKAPWNTYKNDIKTIIINNGVKNIADGAFFDCNYVTSVVMQGGIERIGRYAFSMCNNLEDLTIPSSVTSIADNAFYDCIIKSISIPDSVVSVENEIFDNCRKLTDVNIGKGITAISEGMFVVCESLEKISIPDGVTSIENRAFYNCTSLKIIIIPDSVTNIADNAFGNCTNLTIYCEQGSYADTFAREYNIPVKYTDIYIDKTVTANSENAVSSGAVFEAVSEADYTSRQAEGNARNALNLSKQALNTALNSNTLADNAIEIAQSVRAEIDEFGGFWGLDLPLIKTITLEESVTSIDILSKAEGIELQEFTVLLFVKYLGDAVESNLKDCWMFLRANGGANYFGYKGGYSFFKDENSFAFWHTKIYNKQFALTDLYSGRSSSVKDVPYQGSQGLYDATTAKYSCFTTIASYVVDNLNLIINSSDVSRGAIIPQGSMIFLFGR